MSNPVLTRLENQTKQRPAAPPAPSAEQLQRMYNAPSATQPNYGHPQWQPGVPPGGFPPVGGGGGWGGGGDGAPSRLMTLDDVIVRSIGLWTVLLVAAAVSWFGVGANSAMIGPALMISLMVGLGLGLFMAFTGRANAVTTTIYAAAEGVLLGAISRVFNDRFPGIVVQAVTATLVVAGVTFAVYKSGRIRVTPKFTRMVIIGTISVFGLMLVNLIASFFITGGLGLRSGGPLAIVFSLVVIALAVANLVLDFDGINRAIQYGAPEKFAWLAAFGLMVTMIWLYVEILRLLGYLRN